MKAAKILGSQAPVQGNAYDAKAKSATSLDIDFSDVALAPGEGPPPIPLRSGSSATASFLPSPSPHSSVSMRDGSTSAESPYGFSGNNHHALSVDPPLQQVKHQEISPFLFQEEDQRDTANGRGQESARHTVSVAEPGSSRSSLSYSAQLAMQQQQQQQRHQHHQPQPQQQQQSSYYTSLQHRPSTPPSMPPSASQMSLVSATTPVHNRKSKNPLNKFFRKKSASTLREGEASPSSTPRLLSGGASTGHTPTTGGSVGSAFGSRIDLRGDNSMALGLDEEVNGDELQQGTYFSRDTKKAKLPSRPRTRDKDLKKNKSFGAGLADERAETGLGLSTNRGALGSQGHETPLALDTNFDQIDDFVDTSLRASAAPGSGLGPMDEPLSPRSSAHFMLNRASDPPSPLSPRSGRERSTSVSFLDQQRRSVTSMDSPNKPRPAGLRRLATATGTDSPTARPILQTASTQQQARADIQNSSLQRMTKAEVQALFSARMQSSNSQDSPLSNASTPTASKETRLSMGGDARDNSALSEKRRPTLSESNTLAPALAPGVATVMAGEGFRDDRKASYTSTSSRLTSGSDISPTTSVNNVAKAGMRAQFGDRRPSAQQQGTGGVDAGYKFPPNRNADPRKSSASSAGGGGGKTTTSSWMAPDSWAVQPDNIRDMLRDEEDEANDESLDPRSDALSASPLSFKRDGRPSLTTSMRSGMTKSSGQPQGSSLSASSDATSLGGAATSTFSSTAQGRRETIDSTVSASSTAMDREDDASGDSMYEVLQTSTPLSSSSQVGNVPVSASTGKAGTQAPGVQATPRPGSRGGSAIGQAAAAAGKLVGGLHMPSRIKISRPNTAGSVTGFPAMPKGQPSTPSGEEDLTFSNSWKSSKRAPGGQSQPPLKQSFMRIYKDEGTHSVVSVSLETTAAELRTILARKIIDPAQANRLFVLDKGSERPVGKSEKPALLQRRRLLQAGYTEADSLDELGREDLTFLLKFVYRPDRVTNFDSYSFGNTEADFNVLDLRNRNLEMVPIFLYRHGEWIKSLDLSGNPMHDIPLDFIQLCSNLTTLRLSNLSLKRIPQSIRQAVRLTHLDISNNRIRELAHINLSEIPQLMSLKVQNNRLTELPSSFADMQNLLDLNISNNQFEVFPSVACKVVKLSQLDISFNRITSLPDELCELTRLQRLILAGNNVEHLPSSIAKIESLQTIDVRRNLLQDVSILFSLPRLENIKCEHNSIKNIDVTFGAKLKSVEIGQNPISKASFRASNMCALTVMNLSSANMGKLDDKVLSQLPNLTVLDLDRNNLITLPDTLGQLSQLTKLSCTNNILATLPDSLGMLSNLTELLAHNNNLKSLPPSIWHCGKLRHINVSSNLLESFPEASDAGPHPIISADVMSSSGILPAPVESRKGSAGSLGALPTSAGRSPLPLSTCLTKLRLGDNHLTEEVFSVLSHLPELQILNLSSNELYEIPTYGLSHMVKLRELYLSGNSLGSIPADVMPLLKELRILHINGNKLQTLPAELGKMTRLIKLDVGNNTLKYNISNQQYDWNWNSNPNLHYLNLSGNKRLEINSNPVSLGGAPLGPAPLGGWRRTDTSDFQRLTNLRLLGLMDVTVTLHQMPDESEDRRVRTSLSQINQMAYGISDALGQNEHLSIVDFVVPRFRKQENECLFGLFAGRGHGEKTGSRIAYHLAHYVGFRIQWEIQKIQSPGQAQAPESDKVADILRRAFLRMEKEYADVLISDASRRMAGTKSAKLDFPALLGADNITSLNWRSGASGVLAYLIDRTLFVANCGDALAVMSRNSTAHLVSTKHEPFDRNETLRIRSAEGWVSLQGEVNDTLNVSRSFGHYHLAPIVNAAPAVTQIELTDSDEFVILANNTLWEYIPYQTAVDIARMDRDDPMLAAQKLRDYAITYGAEDHIMVMVVAVCDLFEKSRGVTRKGGQQSFGNAAMNNGAAQAQGADGPSSSFFEPQWDFKRLKMRHGGRDFMPGDRTIARLDREVAPPVGQVAIVFTDIRNSTSLWETNGGMQTAMRLHNFLLRRQLRTIGGYEVKTEGDAFMVSFQTVTSALLWCFQVQIQLLKEAWPQEILDSEDGQEIYDETTGEILYRGLSVRMGIHWGSPVCEADPITRRMDYFGPMVNRSSRVSGAAEGGQILASRDVVNELRAIMSAFDQERRRTFLEDGTEELASPSAAAAVADLDEKEAEDAFRLLNANVSRDVVLLRRLGFAISEIGERRLKGLETPEFLNLVYPKSLTGRFTKLLAPKTGPARRASLAATAAMAKTTDDGKGLTELTPVEGLIATPGIDTEDQGMDLSVARPVEVFEPTMHLLSVDEVKMIGFLCLRLEALAHGTVFAGIENAVKADVAAQEKKANESSGAVEARGGSGLMTTSPSSSSMDQLDPLGKRSLTTASSAAAPPTSVAAPVIALGSHRQTLVEGYANHHPELMLAGMRDDATDEELFAVLTALTSRIWIALSSLSLRKLLAERVSDEQNGLGLGVDIIDVLDMLQGMTLQSRRS